MSEEGHAIRDAHGLVQRFSGQPTEITVGGWQFSVPLEAGSASRAATVERLGGAIAYPLQLLAVDLERGVDPDRIDLHALREHRALAIGRLAPFGIGAVIVIAVAAFVVMGRRRAEEDEA